MIHPANDTKSEQQRSSHQDIDKATHFERLIAQHKYFHARLGDVVTILQTNCLSIIDSLFQDSDFVFHRILFSRNISFIDAFYRIQFPS